LQFEQKTIRDAEIYLGVPVGWWGTYGDVTNGPVRVYRNSTNTCWIVSVRGREVSRHDSREYAIKKARKLSAKEESHDR